MDDPILAASLEGLTYYDDVVKMNRTWNGTEWKTWGVSTPDTPPLILEVEILAPDLYFELPFAGINDLKIDWGDGNIDTGVTTVYPSHTYAAPGVYEIKSSGTLTNYSYGSNFEYGQRITKFKQFGDTGIEFIRCAGHTSLESFHTSADDVTSGITSFVNLFNGCVLLDDIDFTYLDTSNVTNFSSMFYVTYFTSIDLSMFDTSSATTFASMFNSSSNVTSIDISMWDVSNVEDISQMFQSASSLTNVNLGTLTFPSLTSANSLFSSSGPLISVDLSNIDFSNCSNFTRMLSAFNIDVLDVRNIDTSNITDMSYALRTISPTTVLGLGDWDVSNVTNFFSIKDTGTLPVSVYDEILNINTGWPSRGMQDGGGATLNFNNCNYTSTNPDVVAGRNKIINDFNWNIVDAGPV